MYVCRTDVCSGTVCSALYVCMGGWMYGCMDVWMYVWMDGWMDVWMDGCMYRDLIRN